MSHVTTTATAAACFAVVLGVRAAAQAGPSAPPLPAIVAPLSAPATTPEAAAAAQQGHQPPPPTPAHTGIRALARNLLEDFAHVPSWDNARTALVGGAFVVATHPADDVVNQHLAGRGDVHEFFLPGKIIGLNELQIGVALATFAVGRTTDRPKVSHLGMDLLRAQAVAAALTYGLKYAVERQRPDRSGGWSFPSGHASFTFATATTLTRHLGWRAAVPTYLVASYVAASRLHENVHFLSDVVAGAAIGFAAGRTVTRHGASNYTLLPVVVPGGAAIMIARLTAPAARGE